MPTNGSNVQAAESAQVVEHPGEQVLCESHYLVVSISVFMNSPSM